MQEYFREMDYNNTGKYNSLLFILFCYLGFIGGPQIEDILVSLGIARSLQDVT
jgi:hypothetical protein